MAVICFKVCNVERDVAALCCVTKPLVALDVIINNLSITLRNEKTICDGATGTDVKEDWT